MDMSQDERHVTECIELGNDDSKIKCGGPIVEAGSIDACKFSTQMFSTATDLLKCPTVEGKCDDISAEGVNGCVVTTDTGFPVPCKSAFPLTVSETDLTSVEKNDNIEEKSVQDDDKDLTACELTPPVNGYEADKPGKNSQSRERKRSKYLCPPFINLGKESKVLPCLGESEVDDSKSLVNVRSSLMKCNKRKLLTSSVKLEEITDTSAELLMQLQMIALDHLNLYYNTVFDSTELFFNRFRASVSRGLSNSEVIGIADGQNDEEDPNFKADVEKPSEKPVRKMRKEKAEKGSNKKPPSGLYDVNVNFASSPLPSNKKSQRKRKSKEVTPSAPVGPNLQVKGEPGQKKRMSKKGTKPGIPYINGHNVKPISIEVCLQDAGPYVGVADSTGLAANDKSSDELTLDQMKHSLELMTSMLDKSASTISPETRASLENEIKNLLKKVNPMVN